MNHTEKYSFPSEEEAKVFGPKVLARAAQMVAQGRRLSLKSDATFKIFLSDNTKESRACLRMFLSAAIGRKVRRARVTNPDLLPDIVGKKKPRLDVNCELDGGQLADIELQLTKAGDDQKLRAMFYGSKLFTSKLKEGELYKNAPCTYQIFLTDFDPFGDGRFYHRAMMRTDDGTPFSDRFQIIFLNLKVPGRVRKGLKNAANWCRFISGSDRDEVISALDMDSGWKEEMDMATRAYGKITDEERAWAYHLSMDRAEIDYKNEMMLARQAGEKRGIRKGKKEGITLGEKKARKETAKRMIALGKYSMEEIAEISGLTLEEMRKL